MKRYIGIAIVALALAFGFNAVIVNTASAIGSEDPVKLLQEQASQENELKALFNWGGQETERQYRVLEPEQETNFEEIIESVGAGV